MEQAYFYGAGLFLQSRTISMEQAYLYGGGLFPWSSHISTKQAYFVQRKHAHFYGASMFPWSSLTSVEHSHISAENCYKMNFTMFYCVRLSLVGHHSDACQSYNNFHSKVFQAFDKSFPFERVWEKLILIMIKALG